MAAEASDSSVIRSRLANFPVMGRLVVLRRHKRKRYLTPFSQVGCDGFEERHISNVNLRNTGAMRPSRREHGGG